MERAIKSSKLVIAVLLLVSIFIVSAEAISERLEVMGQEIQFQRYLPYILKAGVSYVDASHPDAGDDQEHGTENRPWKTLSYAFQQLQPGDILLVRGGTYENSGITLTEQNSGRENAPITVMAYPGETVVLTNDPPIRFFGASWWTLDGLHFEQAGNIQLGQHVNLDDNLTVASEHISIRNCVFSNGVESVIAINYAGDVLIEGNHFQNIRPGEPFIEAGRESNAVVIRYIGENIVIKDNRFEDIGSDGVHVGSKSYLTGSDIGRVEIAGNEFWVNRPYEGILGNVGENGVDVKKSRGPILISGNIFHGFRPTTPNQDASGAHGEGLIIHGEARSVVVASNLFYDNTSHLNIAKGEGLGPENILAYNNIFQDSRSSDNAGDNVRGSALQVRSARNVTIYHNTFHGNPYYLVSSEVTGCILKNNIIVGGQADVNSDNMECIGDYNAWSQITRPVPAALQGEHDVYAEDLRLDQNLRPLSSSPAAGAGQNVGITTDFSGYPRRDPPDMGALEHIYE